MRVDARHKLIDRIVAASGAASDGKVLPQLKHGTETGAWGDSAYTGQTRVIEEHAPWAADLTQRRVAATSTLVRRSARSIPSDRRRELRSSTDRGEPSSCVMAIFTGL